MPRRPARLPFRRFYREVFLAEHQHPANIAMHVAGTVASAAFAIAVVVWFSPWWLFIYPVVHAVPGLVGHRIFERDRVAGDLRVLRQDYPPAWFIAGNHLLTAQLLTRRGSAKQTPNR